MLTIIFISVTKKFKKKPIKNLADFSKNEISKNNVGRDININQTINDRSSNNELISILSLRADKIKSDFYHHAKVEKIQPLAEDISKFERLHIEHIQALRNNNLTLAHEILNSINEIFNDYKFGKKSAPYSKTTAVSQILYEKSPIQGMSDVRYSRREK